MKDYHYEIRVSMQATMDFEVTSPCEGEARKRVENYLRYVSGGKIDGQAISVKCKDGDKLTHCFVMEAEIEDVNSDDAPEDDNL